jgi:diguanylate cyclase (GGDEF)-like protein
MDFVSPDDGVFLSTMPVTRSQRRLALVVVSTATVLFLVSAPFAKVQLQRVDGFIPFYETAIVIFDLITAILLFGQFAFLRSRALLVLASGYLFTSTMTIAHALTAVSVVLLVLLIEHGRLYGQLVAKQSELRRLSVADPLTAIANRRSFDEALEREWREAVAARTTLALLLIDVDYFKPFNDGYGHLIGDRCLRLVAEMLSGGARRAGGTIARYGGDEFAILLPRTDLERASALARHLCKRVGEMSLPHAHSSIAPYVTISIGVASMSMAHQTDELAGEPTVLIETADRALYAAKAAGRNRTVAYAIEPGGSVERTLNANAAGWPSVLAKS